MRLTQSEANQVREAYDGLDSPPQFRKLDPRTVLELLGFAPPPTPTPFEGSLAEIVDQKAQEAFARNRQRFETLLGQTGLINVSAAVREAFARLLVYRDQERAFRSHGDGKLESISVIPTISTPRTVSPADPSSPRQPASLPSVLTDRRGVPLVRIFKHLREGPPPQFVSSPQPSLEALPSVCPDLSQIGSLPQGFLFGRVLRAPTGLDLSPFLSSSAFQTMGATEPEILAACTPDWEQHQTDYGVAVRAHRKWNESGPINEDAVLLASVGPAQSPTQLVACLDGVSSSIDSICIPPWQQLLKDKITQELHALLLQHSTAPLSEIESSIKKAIQSAQQQLKEWFRLSWDSLQFRWTDEQGFSRYRDPFQDDYEAAVKKGIDVDGILKWNYLHHLTASTLELLLRLPDGRGILFRVGDGLSLIINKDATYQVIGQRKKRNDQTTAAISAFSGLGSIETVEFNVSGTHALVAVSDGAGDNYCEEVDGQDTFDELAAFFMPPRDPFVGAQEFMEAVDRGPLKKMDHYSLGCLRGE